MFTIDFYAAPKTMPVESRTVECEMIPDAVAAGREWLKDIPAATGFVVSDDLNAIVHDSFAHDEI